MPVPGRRLATLVTSVTLLVPGSALAQSAGDEEYQNPLPAEEPAQTQGSQTGDDPPPPEPPHAEPENPEPAAATAQADDELPRTGLPAGLVAAAGVALLAGGAGLRRRA